MINWKLIAKILGQLLFFEAAIMLACVLMSVLYGESDSDAFGLATVTTAMVSFLLQYIGRDANDFLRRRDAYLVVTLSWVVFSLFGAIPFMACGALANPCDAYFETMSGFTTTGASIIDDVEVLPHALLFWRSMTQWIGGLGIVFFTIAIIPSLVGGSVRIFSAEATGPMRTKLHPRLSTNGRWIWGIYLSLSLFCFLAFWAEGMTPFDAVNYAMTVTATGGFSTHNAITGYFNSAAIDYTAILFMFLCGTSFTLLYMSIFKRRWGRLWLNEEFRFYTFMIVVATAAIAFILMYCHDYDLEDAVRSSLFQVVSFATTTGVFNDDAGQWHHLTWVILSIVMIIGGCAGSTSGGFKCVRVSIFFRIVRNEIKHLLHPNAVLPVRVNDNVVPLSNQLTLMAFFSLGFLLCVVTYFIMIIEGIDTTNAITIALSCCSNVGPSLGLEIGPAMSWSMLPSGIKMLLSLLMLMGRLEIFSVIVIFTRAFWRDR